MTHTAGALCAPAEYLSRRILHCPTCKQRRRFAVREAAWYGATVTCCGCGDAWTDGERHERPFKRSWRTEAVADARRTWEAAAAFKDVDHGAWLRRQFGEPIEDVPAEGQP